ncbi:MAG: WYL domain-containing protein [Caldilineaceae bacterium]
MASYRGEQLQLHYTAFNGNTTERTIDPFGMVYRAGHWYLVGYCHLRQDLRTFRMERVVCAERLSGSTFERPHDFDVLAYVETSIAATPGVWTVDVHLDTSLEEASAMIPRVMGLPEQTADGVILRCHVQNLDWFAYFLAQLECPVHVLRPTEAREAIQQLANRMLKLVET